MIKITETIAKKQFPTNVNGIVFDPDGKKHRMTYGEFLKIPQKIKKIKVKTVTYWAYGNDGGEFKGGFYFFRVITLKLNGKYEFEFLSVEKLNNDGKHISYVIPTKKNCPIVGM